MAFEDGELKIFNPSKEISKEITLEILTRHRDALKQARTGEQKGIPIEQVSDNARRLHQVRALKLIISAQREMITISRPIIFFRANKEHEKDMRSKKEEEKIKFEEHENDYNELLRWLEFLKSCEQAIQEADIKRNKELDFLRIRNTHEGDIYELTANFHEMVDDLESSYEKIYLLMLQNKIVSAGVEEDEELSYKEKEAEAIRRIVEA